jgi:LysM repeat protein
MDFSALLAALNQASGFELYRLRAAIDRVLADPKWIVAIQSQLRIGQKIEYFDARDNRLCAGQVLEFRKKEVLVRHLDSGSLWLIAYTAINLDGADVRIRENPARGLSRQEVAVGDTVGFLDQEHQQRSGQIARLNDKTVTLIADGQKWRVAYALLHRVVDADSAAPIDTQIIKR